MAEIQIVQPRPSYDVVSDRGGLWILPQAWKTPVPPRTDRKIWSGRFPHLLGRASPAHRLHRPGNMLPRTGKPDKMTTQMTAETNGGYQESVATLR